MRLVLLALLALVIAGCYKEGPREAYDSGTGRDDGHTVEYTVLRGDTLSSIARAHGVTVQVLVSANGLSDRTLDPGQVLRIPGAAVEIQPPAEAHAHDTWFHPRSDWAKLPIDTSNIDPMEKPWRITVHHSGNNDDLAEPTVSRLPKIEKIHRIKQWACIGYHFIIDAQGEVWEGRPMEYQGAHAVGDNNKGNIGICLLGNFNAITVPQRQRDALIRVLDRLRVQYHIPREQVFGHSHFKITDCPGRHLLPIVDAYVRDSRPTSSGQPSGASTISTAAP